MWACRSYFLLIAIGVLASVSGWAEEKQHCRPVEIEVVYIPNHTCEDLPAQYQQKDVLCSCENVKFGSRPYAKLKQGRSWSDEQDEIAKYNSLYYGR